ncbi:hypothetical protein PG996_002217 [Apiospora saccharicola]|uniref:Uncharacterized protein n=1 Tax=Apiospora saccharicola TaxID=335842 RepID=A0ABR1WLV0_9PEZI
MQSGCEDERLKRIATVVRVANISDSTGTRGVEDQDRRAVLTPLGGGPSLRPWRRVPISRDGCPECSGDSAKLSWLRSWFFGTAPPQARNHASSSATATAQTSEEDTTMANGIDYEEKALHPRPQLANRLCVVTTTFRENPLGDDGQPPGNTPVVTLTPVVQQDETSTANPAPPAATDSARLVTPSVHLVEDKGHFFGCDEQEKAMGEKPSGPK